MNKREETLKDVIEGGITCPNCNGKGEVKVTGVHPKRNEDKVIPCPLCNGDDNYDCI